MVLSIKTIWCHSEESASPIILSLYGIWRDLSISDFYRCSWYNSDGCLLKNIFLQNYSLYWGPLWGVSLFWGPFLSVFLYFLTVVCFLMKFYTDVLAITLKVRKWGLHSYGYFGVSLDIFLKCFSTSWEIQNLNGISNGILHRTSDYYSYGH